MERGLYEGARTNAVDALFSRISESAVPASRRNSQAERRRIARIKKEALKGWAIATGNWHTDLSEFTNDTEPFASGSDSDVYYAKDGIHVIKASKGKSSERKFAPDLDNITLFNYVFPNTAYRILGYGEIDGHFVRILEQPVVVVNCSQICTFELLITTLSEIPEPGNYRAGKRFQFRQSFHRRLAVGFLVALFYAGVLRF